MVPPDGDMATRLQAQRQVLGRAARLLAGAADFGDTLRLTLAACLPALADFGFFDVVVGDGQVRRTVAAHDAPHIEALLAPTQWVKQLHPRLNLCALSTGEAALHPDTDDDWYRSIAANDGHLALLRELGFRSMVTVPMRYRDELVGALTLFMGASGRRHDAEDLGFAAEVALLAAPVVATARLLEQHQAAEAALRFSEERLRMAADAGEVGIWDWDVRRNVVTWSDRVYEMHRLAPGSDFGGLDGFRRRTHPEDWPRVEAALQAALAGGPPYAVEFRHLLPDGQVRWMSTRGQIVRDASGQPLRMVGACIDTTGRMDLLAAERAARREAEAAGRRMELLARAGAHLSGSLDQEQTLRTIATTLVPGIADWCRIDLLDEAGEPQRALAWHQDPERAALGLEQARELTSSAGSPGSMAWAVATKQSLHGNFREPPTSDDPTLRAYAEQFGMHEYFVVPLVARGRVIGAMRVVQAESGRALPPQDRALVQELAHRAALALDNARAYEVAEAARRQAEAANRSKDEFLAMLGHELRNPLAPIATALELMQRREAGAHVQERRIIGRQVAHLSRLIDDLLDVSRITQGKVELQRVPVDLRTVLQHALEQTQPLYERRAQPVQVRSVEAPVLVLGDATRLTQVVCNLLINAAKFTPPEGRVALSLAVEEGHGVVQVEDSGRGIDPELLPRVFELFVQGGQSLDRQTGGLGLGLAIVRMLVERHGGQVRAHSAGAGQGSRFEVRLPLMQVADLPLPTLAPVRRPSDGATHTGVRLLVVDDNTDAAETLAALLRLDGYAVRCAGSADAALSVLEEEVPHLAFLDIGLPGMDGHALARRLRADPRFAAMKLVALTGYGREKDRQQALAARFDEHLVKPVAPDQLQKTLTELLVVPVSPAG